MEGFKADLHCHSTCSDGTLSPEKLVKHAKELGLSGLSITDHDSIDSYYLALPCARQLGLELIPGVELSATCKGISVHVLGYAYNPQSSEIISLCNKHTVRRQNRNKEMLKALAKLGLKINEEDIQAHTSPGNTLGRPHIALAMLKKGYVSSISEAFKKYLGEGKPAYFQGETFDIAETLEVIHAAGGLAVIAHPHLIENRNILKQLLDMNFDGIECYYSKFTIDKNKEWVEIAKKKNWLITGGSDFHGTVKPNIPLGCSWVNQETFQKLKSWTERALS